jgi:hypothetical protein
MPRTSQIELLKQDARDFVNWFTVRRTIGVATVALAFSAVGYAIAGDNRDQDEAIPFIQRAGFRVDPISVNETVGGGSIGIDSLEDGPCTFDNVNASLEFHGGRVVGVDNYQIPLGAAVVTVQNAAQLSRVDPDLHC